MGGEPDLGRGADHRGYGQVMIKLADGLYHQLRAGTCWPGTSWTRTAGSMRGR